MDRNRVWSPLHMTKPTLLDETMARKKFIPDFDDTVNNSKHSEDITDNHHEVTGLGASISSVVPSVSSVASLDSSAREKPVNSQSSLQTVGLEGYMKIINEIVEGMELKSEVQHYGKAEETSPLEFITGQQDVGTGAAGKENISCSKNQQNGDSEELEPLELTATPTTESPSASMPVQKPLIRRSVSLL